MHDWPFLKFSPYNPFMSICFSVIFRNILPPVAVLLSHQEVYLVSDTIMELPWFVIKDTDSPL